MEALSFGKNVVLNKTDEVARRLENQENFTAIDKEKLKQDTVEIASKTKEGLKENVNDNWFVKQLKKLKSEEGKKTLISVGLAVLTTIAFAALGNKLLNKTSELGLEYGDDVIGNSKIYKSLQKFGAKCKVGILNFIKKHKNLNEIHTTLTERREHIQMDIARGYGQGFLGIFSLTPVDILKKAFNKKGITADKIDDAVSLLHSVLKIDNKTARELSEQILGCAKNKLTNKEICVKLSEGIRQGFNCKTKKELYNVFKKMQTNPEFSDFFNIEMKDKGISAIAGSWWPANFIRKAAVKITGNENALQRHLTGNLGDSLVKFNVVNGTMAETKAGTFIQRLVIIPTESISNFVNDKSGVGTFISATCMVPLYNNVQDAPKKQKLPTILNDYVGSMGSFAFSMPAAMALVYGGASMRNLNTEGKVLLKPLKAIGKILGTGLHKTEITKDGLGGLMQHAGNTVKGFGGGAMRFALIMLVLSPFVSKTINKVVSKIFGKPYDAAEAQKQKQLEEQKNTVIPELGITQGEFQEKMMKNPQAIKELQTNPELVKAIDKNPKLMLDLLDGKKIDLNQINNQQANTPKVNTQSPMLQNMIKNGKSNISNETDLFGSKARSKTKNQEQNSKDMATYVPSSAFKAKNQTLSDETAREYDRLMASSDKVLKAAEKYI